VRVSCPNPARADACVSVDGDQLPCRTALDRVDVRVGEHDARLMKLDGRDFYGVLAKTFLGA
jgi:NAD kinase